MGSTRSHWDDVYDGKPATAVSWYQPHSALSLKLIEAASPGHASSVIDVGGGASTLVDDLLVKGYADLTVLDVAEAALATSKARLANKAGEVSWIVADVTTWKPSRSYAVWHDRAVFHFLTEPAPQDAYIVALKAATNHGATVIFATFALDGPAQCSGLPVQRYSAETLARRIGPPFMLTAQADGSHKTPSGTEQRFSYAVLRREAF
jgi:hypothetical protein